MRVLVLFLVIVTFGFLTTQVHASPVTTEEQVTTTEAVVTTTELITETAPVIEVIDGTIYINGTELNKEQAITLLAYYIDNSLGPYLKVLGWTTAGVATGLFGLAVLLISKIGKNTLAKVNLKKASEDTATVKLDIDANRQDTKKLEAKTIKSQALNSLALEGITVLMANSSNPAVAGRASKFQEDALRVLALDDNIPDALQIAGSAAKNIAEVIVGETLKKVDAEKQRLLNSLTDDENKEG